MVIENPRIVVFTQLGNRLEDAFNYLTAQTYIQYLTIQTTWHMKSAIEREVFHQFQIP